MTRYREPTDEECSTRAVVQLADGIRGYACWYPSMGGYVGKAVAVPDPGDDGPDVFVWHDGEFPFGEGSPVRLHHCAPDQFISFGSFLAELRPAS